MIDVFWKDTKETVSSGMPLKKDPGDWRSERRKGELLFTGYPFVLIFFYVNAFFFLFKKKVVGDLRGRKVPRLYLASLSTFWCLCSARSCYTDS